MLSLTSIKSYGTTQAFLTLAANRGVTTQKAVGTLRAGQSAELKNHILHMFVTPLIV